MIKSLTIVLAIFVIVLIPFKIIGYGFLPPDDALRHSAKVIADKDWNQILVLRDDIKMDSHPGWHAVLGFVHKITNWDAHSLVLFSVIALFVLFCSMPLSLFRYPEAWLASLCVISMAWPVYFYRVFLGRPFIFTMAILLMMFLLWPKLKQGKNNYLVAALLIVMIALSTWIHCAWYMFALPVIAFFIAREWKAGFLLALYSAAGIIIGALLTGHPILFLKQTTLHLFLAFGTHDINRVLVSEFQPCLADMSIIFIVALFLIWRTLRGKWSRSAIDSPVFILLALSFILGYFTRRVWLDWGIPALAVWMATEFESIFKNKIALYSRRRIAVVICISVVLYLSATCDVSSRWSMMRPLDYISAEDKSQSEWLPGNGGIIYSDDMRIFYDTFFKNPKAPWRYMLGFEPALMPKEDLEILRKIQKDFGVPAAFGPWVKKMRPEDRMILKSGEEHKPKIGGLEWHYIALNTWSGRKPQK